MSIGIYTHSPWNVPSTCVLLLRGSSTDVLLPSRDSTNVLLPRCSGTNVLLPRDAPYIYLGHNT